MCVKVLNFIIVNKNLVIFPFVGSWSCMLNILPEEFNLFKIRTIQIENDINPVELRTWFSFRHSESEKDMISNLRHPYLRNSICVILLIPRISCITCRSFCDLSSRKDTSVSLCSPSFSGLSLVRGIIKCLDATSSQKYMSFLTGKREYTISDNLIICSRPFPSPRTLKQVLF